MDRTEELALIQRCIDLDAAGSTTLGAHTGSSAAERYTDGERFELEMRAIHRTMPVPWLHAGELPAPGTFKTLATPLGSVLANRDAQGQAHAFHNVCRHRGAQLVAEAGGESSRFTCPYHAWSYGLDGALLAVPGRDECFPGLEAAERGLAAIPVVEAFGLLWLCPGAPGPGDARAHLDEHLGEMAHNLAWLDMASLHVFKRHTRVWRANWKLLSEGGLESYHFRTAHRNTIGPYFLHNCSVQDRLGLHSRMVLPTKKIERQRDLPEGERRLRDFS
ncbi:MAG: Rieske 2Fe-2S domain-containing protein, partial [Halioglobus sp.]|nr:Rieske 2Fe-2S domain-containing protein [Halioglobus sp.]